MMSRKNFDRSQCPICFEKKFVEAACYRKLETNIFWTRFLLSESMELVQSHWNKHPFPNKDLLKANLRFSRFLETVLTWYSWTASSSVSRNDWNSFWRKISIDSWQVWTMWEAEEKRERGGGARGERKGWKRERESLNKGGMERGKEIEASREGKR